MPPAPPSGGGAAAAAGDELSYHATNLRAAAAIIGLRCPWEQRLADAPASTTTGSSASTRVVAAPEDDGSAVSSTHETFAM